MTAAKQSRGAAVPDHQDIEDADYRALAGFRYEVRKFMAFSKRAAESVGLQPQQYQALLVIKARETSGRIATSALAEELFIGTSTAVELLDRLEARGLVSRWVLAEDRRRTVVSLTPEAHRILRSLAAVHRDELRQHVPALISLLARIGPGVPTPT
ncbi:MAG: MarR family transcriptional regulator [Caulobacteraceae bacterium]